MKILDSCLEKLEQVNHKPQWGWFRTSVLVLATLLIVNSTVVLGIHSGIWDAVDFTCPFHILLADHARHGEWLLWTPLLNAGYPVGVDPGIGAFSPLTVGLALLTDGSEWGFRIYWLAIWGLGGIGIVVLARHLFAPRWAAYIAAIGFMFSGIYTGHAEHTSILYTISFLPWILWRLDVALLQRSFSAAAQAGALFGLSALGGYPGMVIISGCYASLWMPAGILLRSDQSSPDKPLPQRSFFGWSFDKLRLLVLTAVVFGVVAIVVMSPTYLAYLVETQNYSSRVDALPREMAVGNNALNPQAILTFASPFLALIKLFNFQTLYPETDVSTCSIYFFPVLLVLALAALWQRPREAFRWYLAALALLCLTAALGAVLPLRAWLYDWFLPMRYFRHSGIFRCYYIFTLVILALFASRDFPETALQKNKIWSGLAILSFLTTIIALGAFVFISTSLPSLGGKNQLIIAIIHLTLVWPGMTVAMLIGWYMNNKVKEDIIQRYIVRLAIADAILSVVICKSMMYTNRAALWNDIEAKHVATNDLLPQGMKRQLSIEGGSRNRNLLEKKAVFRGYSPFVSKCHLKTAENPLLVSVALGENRIWFARQAIEAPLTEDCFDRFARAVEKKGAPCLVISHPPETFYKQKMGEADPNDLPLDSNLDNLTPLIPLSMKLLKYQSRELIFDVQCPEQGWILVTDRWARGWTATVNGQQQPIVIGNFIFRALAVNKGLHRLHFYYCPFGYPWLLIASWSCLGVIFLAPLVSAMRARTLFDIDRTDNIDKENISSTSPVETIRVDIAAKREKQRQAAA